MAGGSGGDDSRLESLRPDLRPNCGIFLFRFMPVHAHMFPKSQPRLHPCELHRLPAHDQA